LKICLVSTIFVKLKSLLDMKKTLVFVFGIAILTFSSCKKDYQCVCTNVSSGNVHYGDKLEANVYTKKAAEATCENNNNLSAGTLKDCHLEDYK